MSWSDRYIGIPFVKGGRDFEGCDCGGLVLLVLREEKGVKATDFRDYTLADFRSRIGFKKIGKGIEELMREWVLVDKPQPFDLCRFRYANAPCHVGVYVGPQGFLHVEQRQMFARITPNNEAYWGGNFIEYRRHMELI